MDLREATRLILGAPAPADLLALADKYIKVYNDMPDVFVLPREHAVLQPVIEHYAHNLTGFVEYVRGMRDSVDRRSGEYAALHEFYRSVNVRLAQQVRRDRLAALLRAAEKKLSRQLSADERDRYTYAAEQSWIGRRTAMLDAARKEYRRGAIPWEDRAALLERFWAAIDAEIAGGMINDIIDNPTE